MIKESYSTPKYPRVMVSAKRHAILAKKAKAAKVSIAVFVEEVFARSFARSN